MTKPKVGRMVWYWPSQEEVMKCGVAVDGAHPLAAIIASVWFDRFVDLTVVDANGWHFSLTNVELHQDDGLRPDPPYCEFVPYPVVQAQERERCEQARNHGLVA